MPLLLRGLDLPESNMRIDVIETLQSAAQDMITSQSIRATVSEHAPSLVTAMVKNSWAQEQQSSVGSLNNINLLVADDMDSVCA